MKTLAILLGLAGVILAAPVPRDFRHDPYLGEWDLILAAERGIVHQDPLPVKLTVTADSLLWEQQAVGCFDWSSKRAPNSRTTLGHFDAKLHDGRLILTYGRGELLYTFQRKGK